ncbi:MAG: VTT domain-containing protein [Verrucomicrobiota bacterium]
MLLTKSKALNQKTKHRPSLKKKSLILIAIFIAALLLPLLGLTTLMPFVFSLADTFKQLGYWTLLPFIIVSGILIGLAIMPSHLSSALAGFLYGLPLGLLAALSSVIIGSLVGFTLTKKTTKTTLREWLDRSRLASLLAQELIDSNFRKCLTAITLCRLPPQVPFALGNIVAASSGAKLLPFILGTLLGMAPRVFLLVWTGSTLSTWNPEMAIPHSLYLSLVAGAAGFGILILWSSVLLKKYIAASELTKAPATNH